MSDPIPADNSLSARYVRFVLRHRRWIALLGFVLFGALGSGGQFLVFEDSYRYFLRSDNPQLAAFDELENVYGKNDNILFVISSKRGSVFEPETLRAVAELTQAAWRIPNASRVDSVTNFQHTRAQGDELVVNDLVDFKQPLSAAVLADRKQTALSEPLLLHRLISDDTKTTGVNVTLELPGKKAGEQEPAVAAARVLATRLSRQHPHLEVKLTGMAMMATAFSESALRDVATLTPLMYGLILVTTLLFLRSWAGTFATLLVIGLSAGAGMGAAGWLGIKLSPPSTNASTMIMTLAVADSIHLLVAAMQEMRAGVGKHEAIRRALRANLRPVFLTWLTTLIGLVAMNFSDVKPLNDLGNITAFGVTAAYLLTISFLPAVAAMLPLTAPARAPGSGLEGIMERVANLVLNRTRAILWCSFALLAITVVFLGRNKLDDQFDESIAFRVDTDYAVEHLTGVYSIEFSLDSEREGGVSDPGYLQKLDDFASYYAAQPGVVHVSSLSETFKRLNRSMHADDPTYYRVPESRELAAQYLLTYELSLPYGLDLTNQIDIDKSASRFIVTLGDVSAVQLRELAARGEGWLRDNAPQLSATAASTSLMFAHISQRNIESMLGGTLFSFLLVAACLIPSLRSLRVGVLSIIPNVLPTVVAFGLWGLWVGEINLGLSMVAAVSFGIVVDDTVHFLSKYQSARRDHNMTPAEAVRWMLRSVGPAVSVTSFVLIAGFLVLALSPFALNSGLGKLTALALSVGVLADLLFLPALLLVLDGRHAVRRSEPAAPEPVPAAAQ
jgi:predicted RND superfamily exporter protein